MLGIYEISVRRISFDTGLNQPDVSASLDRFQKSNKSLYIDGYIVLVNFLKNQSMNTNMITSAKKDLDMLPKSLKTKLFENPSEAFETIRKGMVMVRDIEGEGEGEGEGERETKVESEDSPTPTELEFLSYSMELCLETGKEFQSMEFTFKSKYLAWSEDGWKDGNGKKIKNWKTKLRNTLPYLKPINKQYNNGQSTTDSHQRVIDELGGSKLS